VADSRLRPGQWRNLTDAEVRALARAAALDAGTRDTGAPDPGTPDTDTRDTGTPGATPSAPKRRVGPGQRPSPGGRRTRSG
jgi:hypothetical protein